MKIHSFTAKIELLQKNFFAVRLKWEEKNREYKRNLKKIQLENLIKSKTDIIVSCFWKFAQTKDPPTSELYHIYKPDDAWGLYIIRESRGLTVCRR